MLMIEMRFGEEFINNEVRNFSDILIIIFVNAFAFTIIFNSFIEIDLYVQSSGLFCLLHLTNRHYYGLLIK